MSANMSTLHDICVKFAKKQPGMVDSLTEKSPILDVVRWKPASHGLWNVAEKLTEIEGASFVSPDAPLPHMNVSTELTHTDLYVLGGEMEVPTQRALKFGGHMKYFAERQNYILEKAGMDTEYQLVMKNWLAAARKEKNLKDAGGTGKGWFILAVRFDELANVGLYDPDQFESGRLLKVEYLYGGQEYHLRGARFEGVLGFGVAYRGNFGYQILDARRTCAAIVNIDETHKPTPAMIDDLLADVRSETKNTFLFCSPKAKIYGLNPYKVENIQMASGDMDARTRVETWNGISIVASHNIREKIDNIKVS